MSKDKVIFTKDDVLGQESTVMINLHNHADHSGVSLAEVDKFFHTKLPRGKTYWKLYIIQFSRGDW